MKCFHVVSPVHNKQLRTPDTNYNMTATEITEEVSEAGCAFLEKLLGTKNYKRLLEIKRTYQFNSIQYSVEWLLNQADFSTQDRFYGSVQNAEDSCKTVTTGFLGSNIPEQHPEDRTQNVTNATLDLNNAPKLNIVGDDYSASLHTSSVPNSPARPTSDIEKTGTSGKKANKNTPSITLGDPNHDACHNLMDVQVKEEVLQSDFEHIESGQRQDEDRWNDCDYSSQNYVASECLEFENEESSQNSSHATTLSDFANLAIPITPDSQVNMLSKNSTTELQGGIKPRRFACLYCSYATNSKTNFGAHRVVHTKERPFPCEICGKEFTLKGNRSKHYRNVHKDVTFSSSCHLCGKMVEDLVIHMQTDHHY